MRQLCAFGTLLLVSEFPLEALDLILQSKDPGFKVILVGVGTSIFGDPRDVKARSLILLWLWASNSVTDRRDERGIHLAQSSPVTSAFPT
jgi:hypothetical protein